MYNITNINEYWLYDKFNQKFVRKFSSMYEIREFIETSLIKSRCIFAYCPLIDLSMDFDLKFLHRNYDGRSICTNNAKNEDADITIPIHRYVIIDKHNHIFNYTELVNEIIANSNNYSITYGLGKTYFKPMSTSTSVKQSYKFYDSGCKRVHASRATIKINKSERILTNTIHNMKYYDELADEIKNELNVDVSSNLLKSAYECMRGSRRHEIGDYAEHNYKYGAHENWKKHKKTKQWCNDKHTAKQTAYKDYINANIDREYEFNDIFDDTVDLLVS